MAGIRALGAPTANAPRSNTTAALLIGAVLAAHGLLAWELRARGIFTFGDDAAYLLLGRALRALSYREVQFVGEPIAARFPPGYPALLAVSGALFGERLDVIALLGIALSMSGLWALFDVVRRRWSMSVALVATALAAINPAVLAFVAIPASEPMFTAITLWTLWAADRAESATSAGRAGTSRRYVALVIVLAILAAMTRSAGVTLPVAVIVHWMFRRRWRAVAAATIAATMIVGGWLAWTTLAPRREVRLSYIDDVVRPAGDTQSFTHILAGRLGRNVPAYAGNVSLTLIPAPVTPRTALDNVAWVVVLGGLFVAGWASAWTRWNATALFILAYCGLLAIWPYVLDRFLVPLVPFALALIAIGAARVGQRLRRRPDALLGVTLVGLSYLALRADGSLVEAATDCDRSRVDCAPVASLDFVNASRLAASAAPATARFIAPKGATLYYYGRRQAVFWEEAVRQDSASFLSYLRRNGITHILSTPVYGDYETILRLVEPHCSRFALVRALSPQTLMLAFRDSAASASEGARACAYVRRALKTARAAGIVLGPGRSVVETRRLMQRWRAAYRRWPSQLAGWRSATERMNGGVRLWSTPRA